MEPLDFLKASDCAAWEQKSCFFVDGFQIERVRGTLFSDRGFQVFKEGFVYCVLVGEFSKKARESTSLFFMLLEIGEDLEFA
jgi:hypothetical protein